MKAKNEYLGGKDMKGYEDNVRKSKEEDAKFFKARLGDEFKRL